MRIAVFGLAGIKRVEPGDDLVSIIVKAATESGVGIEEGDVIVVSQKVVSKAEGRIVKLAEVVPSRRALELAEASGKDPKLVELVLRESKRVLKAASGVLIVEDRFGNVCINAGIDFSNVGIVGACTLLPEDPDKSAKRIAKGIRKVTGKRVAVVIADTYSRPFRKGQVNFAIGCYGLEAFRDYRGKSDLFGRTLRVKNVCVADEVACAAELVMGQGDEGIPAAIVRGLNEALSGRASSCGRSLVISNREDLFVGVLR